MSNKIITTPTELANYITWLFNDFILKIKSKDFILVDPTPEKAEAFKKDLIKQIRSGALKDASQGYRDIKELLTYIDTAKNSENA